MSSIKVEYINPFLTATKDVCGTSMNMPIVTGKPRLVQEGERLWKQYQISAMIELSNAMKGFVLVSFSERIAMLLASQLAGETFASVNNDCKDALGEIANLIVGSAKRNLPTNLISISTPKILQTQQVALPSTHPTILLPFDLEFGRFVLQIAMQPAAN